jgi:hypothetical protein
MFGMNEKFGAWTENKSSLLREGYRLGQAWFRGFVDRDNHLENFNDLQQMTEDMDPSVREGVFMGWQSDAYAHDNNMELSVEGTVSWQPEENRGHFTRTEGY